MSKLLIELDVQNKYPYVTYKEPGGARSLTAVFEPDKTLVDVYNYLKDYKFGIEG